MFISKFLHSHSVASYVKQLSLKSMFGKPSTSANTSSVQAASTEATSSAAFSKSDLAKATFSAPFPESDSTAATVSAAFLESDCDSMDPDLWGSSNSGNSVSSAGDNDPAQSCIFEVLMQPNQPRHQLFPKRKFGKHNVQYRAFSSKWFRDERWSDWLHWESQNE